MLRRALLTAILLALSAGGARACAIPVFRYALERWAPAAHEVVIFRRGDLTETEQACVKGLREAKHSNITIFDIDLGAKPDSKWLKLSKHLPAGQPLPLLAVRAPDSDGKSAFVWTSPLTKASVTALLDSPKSAEIVSRLAKGDTAVLLLVESGDPAKDGPVTKLLANERLKMERTPLPKPSDIGPQPLSKLPLKVAFSTARLARNDAIETVFLQMLFKSEPELEAEKGPVVFVIFGRGRLLAALRGDDLNADELGRVAQFLCGACSCQVKELNPGLDLLFTANWAGFVDGTAQPADDKRE